jgi:hypothetical protein
MAVLTTSSFVASWNPDRRFLDLLFSTPDVGGDDAEQLIRAVREWVGLEQQFAVLVDCSVVRGVDSAYRRRSWEFLRFCRPRARIATYGAAPVLRVLIDMFRVGTGVELRSFPDTRAARAWLEAPPAESAA